MIFRDSFPIFSPIFWSRAGSNEEAKAVAQGHEVDWRDISEWDKPPGPSKISAKGMLYFDVIPELYNPL